MLKEPIAITAVLMGVVFVSVKVAERYAWANKMSSVMWMLFLSATASNLGLIPTDAPLYSQLIGFAVPFAVCLVLFTVNLGDLKNAGAPMLVAFVVAAIGTCLGAVVAGLATGPWLERILGDDAWKLAGPFTGTYVGGSLNFFALWEGLEIGQPDLFAAANAVDNLTLFPLFAIWIGVPALLGSRFPVAARWRSSLLASEGPGEAEERKARLLPGHVATLSFLALLVMWLSAWIKGALLDPVLPGVPEILIVTTLALVCAQFRAVRRLEGAWEMGQLSFFVFFAAIGAMIDFYGAIVLSPILFVYVMIIIVVHMVTIYGGGRLLRMDIGVLTVASIATKAGPPLVLAMAEQHREWKVLALPGVVVGLAGMRSATTSASQWRT